MDSYEGPLDGISDPIAGWMMDILAGFGFGLVSVWFRIRLRGLIPVEPSPLKSMRRQKPNPAGISSIQPLKGS